MMSLPIIAQTATLGFAVLLLWAAYSDVRSLTIPNRISVAIVLLYPAYVLASPQPVDWLTALGISGATLGVGFVLFAFRFLGGGDAKLITAAVLWAGPTHLLSFLFLTALAGGGMAVLLWIRHRMSGAVSPGLFFLSSGDADFAKQPMPYAVAIAAGGLYVAFTILSLG